MSVDIGGRLRFVRARHKLSQRELAERAGLSPTTILKLESGRVDAPHPRTIRKLADACRAVGEVIIVAPDREQRYQSAQALLRDLEGYVAQSKLIRLYLDTHRPDQLGVRPGSSLKLTLGDGTPTTLKVTAVYARGLGFGDLTMAHALVARHVDNPLAATVLVKTDRTKDQLSKALTKFPNVQVKAPSAVGTLQAERGQANAEVNHVAMGLILAFTAIAVVNTFAMSISERAREFALLRLAGATRRQVLRMLRTEALAVLLLATVLGSGIALAVLTGFSVGMTGTAAPAVLPLVLAAVVGVAWLLALTATALPGRAALKPRPVTLATARE